MSKKRLGASRRPPLRERSEKKPSHDDKPARGQYSRTRDQLTQGRLSALSDGIMDGLIAVELQPDQIDDIVSTDRISTDWQFDDDFVLLKHDINRRGLRQPIRVRPLDSDWKPLATNPLQIEGKFALQSGRRRLEAIHQLNKAARAEEGNDSDLIKIQAFITIDIEGGNLSDIEERFLENTVRKDLTAFEHLVSVGVLAEHLMSTQGMKQSEVAKHLGVSQPSVSLGADVLRFQELIMEHVDTAKAPVGHYRTLVPKLKKGYHFEETPKPENITAKYEKGRVTLSSGLSVTANQSGTFKIELEDGSKASIDQIEWILQAIEKGASKVKNQKS